jgi:hypothetical protein
MFKKRIFVSPAGKGMRALLRGFNMDRQDGQDFHFYPVYPVHPCLKSLGEFEHGLRRDSTGRTGSPAGDGRRL